MYLYDQSSVMVSLPSPQGSESTRGEGGGGGRWSLKSVTTRLRGGDTSYEGRLAAITKELREAEENSEQAKHDLEYVQELI